MTYVHPWYSQLRRLESTTTCESKSKPNPPQDLTGLPPTDVQQKKQSRDQIDQEENTTGTRISE